VEVRTAPGTPLPDVVQVAAGYSQSYALKSDGTVVAWGFVTCDGTGLSTDARTPYATPLAGLSHVRKITATGSTALFLLDDGSVLSCGSGDQILGRVYTPSGAESAYIPRPVKVPAGTKVVDASMYGDVGVLATDDGRVLTWGQNNNQALNVLGLPAGGAVQFATQVPLPPGAPVVDVENHNSSSTFALRADGSMLVWGGNIDGINGLGSTTKVSTDVPTEVVIPGRIIVGATTASWNTYALTRPADPTTKTPASWVSASVDDAAFSETGGGAVTITLDQKVRNDVTFQWAVTPGTAGADDVQTGTGTAVIPAGQTSVSVPVPVVNDARDEDDEAFTFALTSVDLGVQLMRPQATGTVIDDDAAPTAAAVDVSVDEGDTSLTDVPVHLKLSAPSGKEVVVNWATANGSATAGGDYVATGGEARFAPGETDHVVHLGAIGDTVAEPTESFAVGVTGGQPGTVTLRDDERLAVSVQAPTVTEGTGSATTPAPFKVVLTAAPATGETVDVPWTVVEPDNGNGDVAGDVLAASGTAHLTAAQPTATVTSGVVADSLTEGAEHFALEIGTPTSSLGRTILKGAAASATIEDDDTVTVPTPTWPFTGFFAPVDNAPVVNVVKAGSAVPVKFSLGGNRGLGILAAGSPASAPHACSAAPADVLESTATPGSSTLTYDATSGRYHYVWQTAKAWAGSCRTFVLKLSDGTTHTAEFRFK
jgi:hypothetical protein